MTMSSELPGELSSKIRRVSGRIRLLSIALFCVLLAGIGEKPDGYLGLVRDEAPAYAATLRNRPRGS